MRISVFDIVVIGKRIAGGGVLANVLRYTFKRHLCLRSFYRQPLGFMASAVRSSGNSLMNVNLRSDLKETLSTDDQNNLRV